MMKHFELKFMKRFKKGKGKGAKTRGGGIQRFNG